MNSKVSAPKDFGFGEDEGFLRDVARKLLDDKLPLDKLRQLVAFAPEPIYEGGQRSPWDEQLWSEIVSLGWTGLAISEKDGGTDFALVGIAALMEEVGRHALPSPLVPTLSASLVLRAAGGDIASKHLTRIAEGSAASLAVTNDRGSWEAADAPLVAREEGENLVIDGAARFVQDGFKADMFIVSARLNDSLVLVAVDHDEDGVSLGADHIHDLTRDQASIFFENVTVQPAGIVCRDALEALEKAWPGLLVLVAADLCGASEWLLQTTTEYATQRVQFDRPIGFFQAVKHPLVDAMVDIDRARSLLYHACAEIDAGSANAEAAARMAKSAASDAAAFMSDRAVQLHGGIGFTWECGIHIYFKRNLHNQALLGDGTYQRARLADLLMGPIGANAPRESLGSAA